MYVRAGFPSRSWAARARPQAPPAGSGHAPLFETAGDCLVFWPRRGHAVYRTVFHYAAGSRHDFDGQPVLCFRAAASSLLISGPAPDLAAGDPCWDLGETYSVPVRVLLCALRDFRCCPARSADAELLHALASGLTRRSYATARRMQAAPTRSAAVPVGR